MTGQQKTSINEQKPSKFMESENGCEVLNNDGTVRIFLRRIIVMDGSMESDFCSTTMWIKEDGMWLHVSNTQNYRSKEEFINAISESEDFTEAVAEFNNQKQQ